MPFLSRLCARPRSAQFVQFFACVALIVRHADWMQPEFGAMPVFSNMHMHGFTGVAFVGKKEKAISLKLKNVWHG
jgi:hypothetical protein